MTSDQDNRPASGWKTLGGYLIMLAGTAAIYWFIRGRGMELTAPAPNGPSVFGAASSAKSVDALMHVLLALAVVIVAARAIGNLFRRFEQPPVIGEIIAGICLGPSLLGRIAPSAADFLLPKSVAPFLGVLSQVGVILYMFLVGLELDPGLLRKRGHSTVAISHASIIAPFLLGCGLALFLYPKMSSSDVPFSCFALFLGVSMSVTAFPVLARILTDRQIHTTRMGVISLTCAAVDDVTAWCLLAFVVSVVQTRMSGAFITFGLAIAYIAAMIFIVRPLMVRLTRHYGNRGRLTQGLMAVVFVALLASSLATDYIGIHAVFGAFALGAIIPHDSGLARELTDRLEDLVIVLFLPAFFAFTGMRTQIGLVSGVEQWLICGLIMLIACAGKFGGSMAAARLTGLGWRDSAALGVLMNTRGLMELIVLNIGLELKVISPTLFAMLVIMAIATTFATTPLLHLLTRKHPFENDMPSQPVPVVEGGTRQGGLLLPVSNPVALPALLELAMAATRTTDPPTEVLALVRRPPGGIRSGLREREGRQLPHTPLLDEALARASAKNAHIRTRALWTDDPAADIVEAAADRRIGWVVLGFHRSVFGSDLLGGVVKEILTRLDRVGPSIAVVIHGHERPLDKIVAVADDSDDGRATLEFAARLVRGGSSTLHAVLVPRAGTEPEPNLQAALKDAAKDGGRWLHTDVLTQRNPAELAHKTQGDLVLIGMTLANELGLPLDDVPGAERCVVLVRGTSRPRSEPSAEAELPA